MRNDQWFEPGDKVMRVAYDVPPLEQVAIYPAIPSLDLIPYGKVFCVESCYQTRVGPRMRFVGVLEPPESIGIYTNNFRKVEEIRLCVEAAKRVKETELQET